MWVFQRNRFKRVIAAGSLLEPAMDAAGISFPVGRVQFLSLRPMTFAEVLPATGGAPLAVRLYAGHPSSHDVNFENVAYRLINVPHYAAALIPRYVQWGDAPGKQR